MSSYWDLLIPDAGGKDDELRGVAGVEEETLTAHQAGVVIHRARQISQKRPNLLACELARASGWNAAS